MCFEGWLIASALVFFGAIALAIVIHRSPYRSGRVFTPGKLLVGGTFVASVLIFMPYYLAVSFESAGILEYFKASVMAIPHAVRLYAFDGGYAQIFESETVRGLSSSVATL